MVTCLPTDDRRALAYGADAVMRHGRHVAGTRCSPQIDHHVLSYNGNASAYLPLAPCSLPRLIRAPAILKCPIGVPLLYESYEAHVSVVLGFAATVTHVFKEATEDWRPILCMGVAARLRSIVLTLRGISGY